MPWRKAWLRAKPGASSTSPRTQAGWVPPAKWFIRAAKAVPALDLLEAARKIASGLHETTFDAQAKFPHLAQIDVPVHTEEAARSITLSQGISDEDFTHYPAYSAITDSVLKGARLSLADATALEMTQFLRLMFNPVAGRMVRTLFLERLRGERELASPPETHIAQIQFGAISLA